MNVITNSTGTLVSALAGLYMLAVLLRFLLQIAKADFYNPLSQAVVSITNPAVKVFRGIVPGYRGIDFSCLVLALAIEMVMVVLLSILTGISMPGVGSIITWSLIGVLYFILQIYWFAMIVMIVMSIVMMLSGSMNPHPAIQLIWQLTAPIMDPFRKIIPPMAGLDFSPIFVFILLEFIRNLLAGFAGSAMLNPALVVGI